MLSIFSHVYWPSESLLWKNAYQLPCPFLNRIVCFLLWDIMSSLYILDINPYKVYDLQIFSPIWKKYIYVCIWLHWSSCGTKDLVLWPHVPCVGSVEFWPLDHKGSPSPILGIVFSLSVLSLCFDRIHFIFSFVVCTSGVISKKSLPNPMSWRFLPVFSSESLYF